MAEPLVITLEHDPKAVEAKMRRMAEAARGASGEAIQQAAIVAEATARREAPRDTAALARSITSEVKPLSARVFSTRDYAIYAELGRKPGARMPPPAALEGFVRRKFGLTGAAARGMAFVIARAIGRRGIRGRFFMRAAAQKVAERFPGLLASAAEKVERVWSSLP